MPPATLRQKRAHETRRLILDSAYGVFSARGYGQTSIDAIISEAGVSKGAFYHHFDGKEALFNALLEDRIRQCADQMRDAAGSATSLRGAVEGLARAGIQSYKDDPEWTRLFMEFWLQATRDEFARRVVADSMRQCRELVAGMLRLGQQGGTVRDDIDADAAAILLIGVFDGAAIQASVDPAAVDLDRLISPLADMIQRFIEKPPDRGSGRRLR